MSEYRLKMKGREKWGKVDSTCYRRTGSVKEVRELTRTKEDDVAIEAVGLPNLGTYNTMAVKRQA